MITCFRTFPTPRLTRSTIEWRGREAARSSSTAFRDKARLTTIILSHFHRNHLDFDSILVFSDQAEIPRVDLARLSDVGGDMLSSLASREDFRRKVERRVG